MPALAPGHAGTHSHGLCPDNMYLPCGYEQRELPEYFSDDATDGVVWQPDVYGRVAELAAGRSDHTVIDLGCGRAGKLTSLAAEHPGWRFVGVDYGSNIAWCASNLGFGRWVEADLESDQQLPIEPDETTGSIVVCSDVLEHLVNPDAAVEHIRRLLAAGAALAVLSTPAREKRAGIDHPGPPGNTAHVREWASPEFHAYVRSRGLAIDEATLTRSDDSGGGLTTQLVVVSLAQDAR